MPASFAEGLRIWAPWFHICCASTTGSARDSHLATGGPPPEMELAIPWQSAQCFAANACLPRPASPGFSK